MAEHLNQLTLALPERKPDFDANRFVLSESNASAIDTVRAWFDSNEPALAVCGPAKSGKTHLAHYLQNQFGGVFINADDILTTDQSPSLLFVDAMPPQDTVEFVGVFEKNLAENVRMILLGEGYPGDWAQGLKDMRTRMEALPRAVLNEPDEALIRAVIQKAFLDRQIKVDPDVINYAVQRLPRTFAAAHQFVDLSDKTAMAAGKKVTKRLVQSFLHEF